MQSMLFLTAFAVLVMAVLAFLRSRLLSRSMAGTWPLHARKAMSVSEQILYLRLLEALPERIVLAKVSLARFLAVDKGSDAMQWYSRIHRMTADFVICRKDATVVAVIELDDAGHNAKERRATFEKKERALNAAGIPIVRWQAKLMPEVSAIRRQLGQGRLGDNQRTVKQAA